MKADTHSPDAAKPLPRAEGEVRNPNGREAFALALQTSEVRRLQLLLGVLVILMILATLRFAFGGVAMSSFAYPARLITLGSTAVYALFIMGIVRRAGKEKRLLPQFFWISTAALESIVPTINIITLLKYAPIDPVDALVAPAMIVYFLFIILSVLRCRPSLCLVTAGLATVQHLALVLWTLQSTHSGASLYPYYLSYSVLILTGGICAASVSHEIRKHVHAGLREAYIRAELTEVRRGLEIAREIQQSLLPEKEPTINGFDIAGWSQPADQTGGDYYDWQTLPDGRLAVSVADVTGHGIGPAMVTAVCRAYSRASFPNAPSLGVVMDRVNDLLVSDLRDGRFVTAVVAILDPANNSIQLSSAGHGPMLLYRASSNTVESIDAQGLPFGIATGLGYGPPCTVELGQGDILILLTDGFSEWANVAGELFGVERLGDAIRTSASLTGKELIARMHEEVLRFAGGTTQMDDLTAVVVRRHNN